jgi:hypothetical protein
MPTPLNQPLILQTVEGRVKMAQDTINQLGGATGDSVYLGIGHGYIWANNDQVIPQPQETIDYLNQVHRDLVALKKLSVASASLVVQRSDWANNTYVYDAFANGNNMYTYVQVSSANGTVNVQNSNIILGTNLTTFNEDYQIGDIINITGDGIYTYPVQKEVISIANSRYMTVNSNVSGTYVNSSIENWANTFPNYAKNFYVRNVYDQVFVCLDNNNGTVSNSMPLISVGGSIPSNPYVITDDGYKWKYLYTMSAGQKKLFLTPTWMPVGTDALVTASATDGRLDVIDILAGGRGYNANVAACNAPILVLTGDGSGANVSAQVDANGTITAINVLSGGEEYTAATLTANTGANGSGAVFAIKIGPRGGWGSNAALELGATTLMISTTLSDTENGTIPTEDAAGEFFKYRQLSLILNPLLEGSGNVATNTNFDMTTVIQVAGNVSANIFQMGDIAYQNPQTGILANAAFYGTVVWYNATTQELHLNNIGGSASFIPQSPISGTSFGAPTNTTPYITTTAFTLTEPEVQTFSGVDLYVENVAPIQRFPLQVEEVRLIFSF